MPRNKKPDAVSYVFRVQWLFIDVNYENLESKPIWPTNGKYQQVSGIRGLRSPTLAHKFTSNIQLKITCTLRFIRVFVRHKLPLPFGTYNAEHSSPTQKWALLQEDRD